jgi:hypothetical protein
MRTRILAADSQKGSDFIVLFINCENLWLC